MFESEVLVLDLEADSESVLDITVKGEELLKSRVNIWFDGLEIFDSRLPPEQLLINDRREMQIEDDGVVDG